MFQRLALPIRSGKTRIPGIKIHDIRMIRLMEVLLHSGTQIRGWRSADIHRAILEARGERYTLTQLRYDLRKMKGHGLIQRDGNRYAYRLTDKGTKVALLFVLFHKRVCGPLANGLFNPHARSRGEPKTKLDTAYRRADKSVQPILELLAA